MTPPSKKRRLNADASSTTNGTSATSNSLPIAPLSPATEQEKREWQGFCELDSEPAYFNVMLREWGVKGVKVQEVYGLDDAMLAFLPQPVYGLVFLFRYRADDVNKQEMSCPDHVWFANQTHDHACATVSLLNIVNNIPNVDLGENLQRFKDFTKTLTPALRGDQIGNFEFVKQIHNSFTRKMDMLNIDLGLQNRYDDRRKPKAKPAVKKTKTVIEDDSVDEEAAFHFIAYVPIEGHVWKLDGLDRQPQKLGSYGSKDWLSAVRPNLEDRMAQYMEGQIQFVLLSLVKDPLDAHRASLVQNIKSLIDTEARLARVKPDWECYVMDGSNEEKSRKRGLLLRFDLDYGITAIDVEEAAIPDSIKEQLRADCPAKLMSLRQELITDQVGLRQAVRDEQESLEVDERRARERRHDYGPFIHTWLRMLAAKDEVMKDLIETVR